MPTLSALIQREDCPIWSTALAQLMFTTSRAECSELRSQRVLHIRSLPHRLELGNSAMRWTHSVVRPMRSERGKRFELCRVIGPPFLGNLPERSFRGLGQYSFVGAGTHQTHPRNSQVPATSHSEGGE